MKSILFLHASADLYGSDKVLLQVIEKMSREGWQCHVVLPYEGVLQKHLLEIRNVLVYTIDLAVLRRKTFTPFGFLNYVKTFVSNQIFIYGLCKRFNIKTIYTNTSVVFPGAVFAKIFSLRHIWHLHEILEENVVVNQIFKFLVKNFSSKVITPSDQSRASFSLNESLCKVVPNGVDLVADVAVQRNTYWHDKGVNSEALIFLCAGRLTPRKGQLEFIQMASRLCANGLQASFVLAGSTFYDNDPYPQLLKDEVQRLNLGHCVFFLGEVRDMHTLLSVVDVVVMSSQRSECFPMVILEAMGASKLVAATALGGPTEMIENGVDGILFADLNPDQWAKEIRGYLEEPQRANNMRLAAKTKVMTKFSTELFQERIFEEITESRGKK